MSDADVKRTIERLYDEKDALRSQNQALQERAEKAEAALRRIEDIARPGCTGIHGYEFSAIVREVRALSPTQEIDPE